MPSNMWMAADMLTAMVALVVARVRALEFVLLHVDNSTVVSDGKADVFGRVWDSVVRLVADETHIGS